MSEYIVEVKQMSFSRQTRSIYNNINMKFPKGKITAIMGPSGIGKTTLLRLIGGQLKPDNGQIIFQGSNIPTLSRQALYQTRQNMGMLFQSGALFTDMSVFDNVAFAIREHTQLPDDIIRTMVLLKLEAVGLRGARELMPHQLSGGMARRAALARAIALDPLLIMYDEPFTGQDPISMGVIVKLIKQLNDSLNLSSIVVSHDVNEVLSIADYVYIITAAQIIGEGTPQQLQQHKSPLVQQFLQGSPDGPVPFHYQASDYHRELLEHNAIHE